MRILLFSSDHGEQLSQEALLLREFRGYDVLCFHELASPDYVHNNGMAIGPVAQNETLTVEMLGGRVVVLHPDTDPATALQLAHLHCWYHRPLVRFGDLAPDAEQFSQEWVDSVRCERDLVRLRSIWQSDQVPFEVMQEQETIMPVPRWSHMTRMSAFQRMLRRARSHAARVLHLPYHQPAPIPYRQHITTTTTA